MRKRIRTPSNRAPVVWMACLGLIAAALTGLTGCQEKVEAPKSAGYYTGPMQGKKLQGAQDSATAPKPGGGIQ